VPDFAEILAVVRRFEEEFNSPLHRVAKAESQP